MSHEEEARIVGHVLQSSRMGELNVTSFFIKCELPNKGAIFEIHNGLVEHNKTEADPKRFSTGLVITFRFHKLSVEGLPENAVFVRFCTTLTWDEVNARAKSRTPFSQSLKPSQIARIKGIASSTASSGGVLSGDEGLSDDESLTPYTIPKIAVKHTLLRSPISSSLKSSPSICAPPTSSEWTIDDDKRATKKPKPSSESVCAPHPTTPPKTSKMTPRKTPPLLTERKENCEVKTPCKYGASCYQTNPYHLENYFHPVVGDGLPPCKYGPACYRTNPEHRLQFSHD